MAREWNNVAVMRMLLIILIALCLAPMAQAQFSSVYNLPVATAYHSDSAEVIHVHVRNTSGATIVAGTPVFEIGFTGGNLLIGIASSSSFDSMPAIGLLAMDVDNNTNGVVIKFGILTGIKTDSAGWSDGTSLYVDSGAHGLTHIKPTGANLVQRMGQIVDAGPGESGSFDIFGAGRSNDLPNFAQGPNYVWAGAETDSIPIEIDLDSAIAATALLQTDTAAYALTILNNPVITLLAVVDSFDIQGSVRIDGGLFNDGRLGVGTFSDDYKIIMMGNGGATAFGSNTEASLHLLSTYTGAFGYGADLSFGISSSVTPLNIIGGIRGRYTGLTADSGLGGDLAFYTKNDGTSSTPELAMTIDQDKNVTIYGGINVAGNIVLGSGGGTIIAGSGGEIITTDGGKLDGFALLANSVDDLAIDFGSGANQVDLADIPGGIAPASAFDFGGATSLEIPAVDDPATTAEGHIAWDANDDAIEVYSGDEGESALIPIYHHIVLPLALPDSIQVYIPKLFLPKFNELMYPHGVEIDLIALSSDTTVSSISVVIEEWSGADPPVFQNIVTTISTVTETYAEEAPDTDGNLDANDVLVIVLPAGTGLNGYKIEIFFHVTAGN